MADPEPKVCEPGGGGTIFPLLESEQEWSSGIRVVLYILALLYLFYGVNVVADKFVSSIERITSKKRRVMSKVHGQVVTVEAWNETIANLTLMALGSSAPEILLSIVEIVRNDFHAGQLGPSTIVGSAAFNLFCIIAVCIVAIPSPETRQIKETSVFVVTALFSLFAYFWLVFIVQIASPDVVEPWEGALTLVFFGVLLVVSYMADKGYLSDGIKSRSSSTEEPAYQLAGDTALDTGCGVSFSSSDADAVKNSRGQPIECAAGVITFPQDTWNVMGKLEPRELTLPVFRKNGFEGDVQCRYRMESLTAVAGYDYEDEQGHIHFLHGESRTDLVFTVLPKRLGESSDQFQIILEDPQGGAILNPNSDGGSECNRLTVTISNESDELTKHMLSMKATRMVDRTINMDSMRSGACEWQQCIVDSIFAVGDGDEDDDGSPPSLWDWIFHIVSMPWNLGIALLCPPPAIMGGWPCFLLSLAYIGGITVLIIDFAELFGCCAGIEDAITAITLVALGTSMPDLFASKTSAMQDEYADASIVNVTGSNSVNVFLGIGLPWTLAAIYWAVKGPDDKWRDLYGDEFLHRYPNGAFIVKGGDLGFSVVVYSVGALMCLLLIRARRVKFDGELGGPYGVKVLSAMFLALLWIFYQALSIWKIKAGDVSFATQAMAIGIALVFLENMMLAGVGAFYYWGRQPEAEEEQQPLGHGHERSYHDLEAPTNFGSLKSPPRLPQATSAGACQLRHLASEPEATVIGMAQQVASGIGPYGGMLQDPPFQDPFEESLASIKFASAAMVCLAASRFKRGCKSSSASSFSSARPAHDGGRLLHQAPPSMGSHPPQGAHALQQQRFPPPQHGAPDPPFVGIQGQNNPVHRHLIGLQSLVHQHPHEQYGGELHGSAPRGHHAPLGHHAPHGPQRLPPLGHQSVHGHQGAQGFQGFHGPHGHQSVQGHQGAQGFQGLGFQGPHGHEGRNPLDRSPRARHGFRGPQVPYGQSVHGDDNQPRGRNPPRNFSPPPRGYSQQYGSSQHWDSMAGAAHHQAAAHVDSTSPRMPRNPSFYSVDEAPMDDPRGRSRGRSDAGQRDSSLERLRGAAGRAASESARAGRNIVGWAARTLADPQGDHHAR